MNPLPYPINLFFTFRSPYSYLALPETLKLGAEYDAIVNLRPVYSLAVRVAQHEKIPFRFSPARRRRSPPPAHRTWHADLPHHALRQLVHSFHCYLFKLRFHGRLIFSLNRRP